MLLSGSHVAMGPTFEQIGDKDRPSRLFREPVGNDLAVRDAEAKHVDAAVLAYLSASAETGDPRTARRASHDDRLVLLIGFAGRVVVLEPAELLHGPLGCAIHPVALEARLRIKFTRSAHEVCDAMRPGTTCGTGRVLLVGHVTPGQSSWRRDVGRGAARCLIAGAGSCQRPSGRSWVPKTATVGTTDEARRVFGGCELFSLLGQDGFR